ncbi:PAS domain S-box protein, partial [candidate division KSB3 bacterium]|nr:PAS domain S-box protein [candidate division KSB3 bacterium]MBD3326288.1 PAS domain S-box protein [candidate division KSB3 bacterium]
SYAVPIFVVLRSVHARFLDRLRNPACYGAAWFLLIFFCYQAFTTPITWGILAFLHDASVWQGIIQGWRDQPYIFESLAVGLISALGMMVIRIDSALRASRRELATTLYSIGDGVIATDTAGRVQRMNPEAGRLTGWSEAEAQGQPLATVFQIVNEETRKPVEAPVNRVLGEGVVVGLSNHTLLTARDGTTYPIADSGAPIVDPQGNITGVVLVFRDNTERKQAENALREGEEKYRLLFEEALNPILMVDADGHYIDANKAALEFLECGRAELLGKTVWDFTPPALLARQKQEHAPFVRRRTLETDYSIHGKIKILLLNVVPLTIQGATILYGIGQDITERKQAEEALRQSEERYRLLIESIHDSVYVLDREWRHTIVNQAAEEFTGMPKDSLLGAKLTELFPGVENTSFFKAFQRVMDTRQPETIVSEYRFADGRHAWYEVHISPVPEGILCISRNITDRKAAEKALQESERQKNLILNATAEMVAYYDTELRVIWANRAAGESIGKTPDELVGLHCYEIWHQRSEPCVGCPILKVFADKSPHKGEIQTPDGRHWFLRGYPILDDAEDIIALVEFGQDITERKQAEEALQKKSSEQALLLDTMDTQVWYLTDIETYGIANRAHAEFLGLRREAIEHKHLSDFLPAEVAQVCKEGNCQVFETKATIHTEEWVPNAQGEQRLVAITKTPRLDHAGNVEYVVCVGTDITERKQAEEQITTALKEKEVLLRELYHRTKNNMQVISAMLALRSYYVEDEAARRVLQDMDTKIQSMALVHQKLYQSQNLSRINLGEYIHELAALLFQSYAPAVPISLEIDVQEAAVLIDTAMPCGLVIHELLSNALKHAFPGGRGGRITIRLRRIDETHLDLVVADNGVGMPADVDVTHVSTLGLKHVIALVQHQLGGDIDFDVQDGVACHITFRDDLYTERV